MGLRSRSCWPAKAAKAAKAAKGTGYRKNAPFAFKV
jgi:hypothetical protein